MTWLTVGLRPLERSLDRTAPVQAPWAALAIGRTSPSEPSSSSSPCPCCGHGPSWTPTFCDSWRCRWRPTPYADHAVEYAPVELGVIRLIGSSDTRATGTRLVIVCFLLDLLAFAGMWSGWGRRTAISYLWLGVPLLVLMYLRLWYLPVALSVWEFALCGKGDPMLLAS